MEDSHAVGPTQLLFGYPFLKTANTKIDMTDGSLTMEFDGDIIKFNAFDKFKNPNDNQSLSFIEMVNVFVQEPSVPKAINEADIKGKDILLHDLKSKHVEERGSTTDKALKGKGYKCKSYIKESSYFST